MTEHATNPSHPEVFISYAQDEDSLKALDLADRLEATGATVWIAERSIHGSENYGPEVVSAIKSCAVFVVLCSQSSLQSEHVAVEVELAFEARRPRLPLMLDKAPIPDQILYWLVGANRIDISGPTDTWMPKVVEALRRLGVPRAAAAVADVPTRGAAPLPHGTDDAVVDERRAAPRRSGSRVLHSKILWCALGALVVAGTAAALLTGGGGSSSAPTDRAIAAAGFVQPSDLGSGWRRLRAETVNSVSDAGGRSAGETVFAPSTLRKDPTAQTYLIFDGATLVFRTADGAQAGFGVDTEQSTLAGLLMNKEFAEQQPQDLTLNPSEAPKLGDSSASFTFSLTVVEAAGAPRTSINGIATFVQARRSVMSFFFLANGPQLSSSNRDRVIRTVVRRVNDAQHT